MHASFPQQIARVSTVHYSSTVDNNRTYTVGVKVSRDDQKKMFPTCSSKERYEDVFVSLALALCRRVSKKNNFWITNPTNDHLNITLYRHKQRIGETRKKGLEENEEENDEKKKKTFPEISLIAMEILLYLTKPFVKLLHTIFFLLVLYVAGKKTFIFIVHPFLVCVLTYGRSASTR